MPIKKIFSWGGMLVAVWLLVRCAGQVYPSGGPPDLTPPTIIRTVPDTNAVHVSTQSVSLEFSKYVVQRSLEESIFISPYVGDLEFEWSGREVTIKFAQPLRKSTTYVVNIGTDVRDIREQNRMASGFTLAFSTGDSIDRGYISGRVFDNKPEGVMIFAYKLTDVRPDTLDPGKVKPDYIMQTGKSGSFALSNIALGPYRLFAIRDEYKNLLYDKQIDQFGVTNGDITLSAAVPRVNDIWFRLSQEDTTRPFLSGAQAPDRDHILVRFSESLDSLSFKKAEFAVTDTFGTNPIGIAVRSLSRLTPAAVSLVTSAPLESGKLYRLTVRRVYDRAGNEIDTLHAASDFSGSGEPDTVKPTFAVHGVADSMRGVPLDQTIDIDFSEPVRAQPMRGAIALLDSARAPLAFDVRWYGEAGLALVPRTPFWSNAWYQLTLIMDSLRDYRGNSYRDSTYRLHFQTLDLRTTGVIEGTVVDDAGTKGTGQVMVTASSVDLTPPRQKTIRLKQPGKFEMEQIVEGKYVISGYRDADSSGTYSYGLPYPFVPSERFAVYPDTVKVRARWGVEGVVLRFKK